MTQAETARKVKRIGREAGFDLVRICDANVLDPERDRYLAWIEQGRHGEMRWITPDRAVASADPHTVVPGARSVISVAMAYGAHSSPRAPSMQGKIARYAWGEDYHQVLGDKLRCYVESLCSAFGGQHRWCVDTAPQMDKGWAARSGLGWYGKNTNILTEKFGSFVLLGEIITTLELKVDPPIARDCGSCRLCVVACPTGALNAEYSIDSRLCISYLTIEHRGPIPRELRSAIGRWVFGCDICQDVCPPSMAPYLRSPEQRRSWALGLRRAVDGSDDTKADDGELAASPPFNALYPDSIRPSIDLVWLLRLSHDQYVEAFRGSSIKRAKDWMLRRNAAIALGNVGNESAIEALSESLCNDEHPIVRGHSAWALDRLADRFDVREKTDRVLECALNTETDTAAREEIVTALRSSPEPG